MAGRQPEPLSLLPLAGQLADMAGWLASLSCFQRQQLTRHAQLAAGGGRNSRGQSPGQLTLPEFSLILRHAAPPEAPTRKRCAALFFAPSRPSPHAQRYAE